MIAKRKEKGLSQEEIAHLLNMEQSQYSRRETGSIHISKKEWDELAKVLEVPLEEIYEPHDGVYIINYENGDYSGSQNYFHNIPEYILDSLNKYISKLEAENQELKEENERLKGK